MTTLYVSDLDGTLLNSNQTLSPFTIQTINQLVSDGMLFSYATARSYQTAKKVTQGLQAPFPLIVSRKGTLGSIRSKSTLYLWRIFSATTSMCKSPWQEITVCRGSAASRPDPAK